MDSKEVERWYQENSFGQLEKNLEVEFRDKAKLIQSFVHRSFLNENVDFPLPHNERLEFLGDAVLELAVTEHLYQRYQNPEGELTRWRAALVNTKVLAEVARRFNFQNYLFLSRGESGGKVSEGVLADTVEAFIGALYLDQGKQAVEEFVRRQILELLDNIIETSTYIDPKSALQELVQSRGKETPRYQIMEASGPDHDRQFEVGVFIGEEMAGSGRGRSKQEAEQEAAGQALNFLKKDT